MAMDSSALLDLLERCFCKWELVTSGKDEIEWHVGQF
jgi:hypothetical protein